MTKWRQQLKPLKSPTTKKNEILNVMVETNDMNELHDENDKNGMFDMS